MAQPVSDDDRRRLEEAIAAALTLIYQGRSRHALAQIGTTLSEIPVSDAARAKIEAFAAERAQLVQDGINQRMADAQSSDDTGQAAAEIDRYNQDRLMPYLAAWAANQALVDTYRDTPDPNGTDQTAAEAVDWEWIRYTDSPPEDECQDVADASPAPLDALLAISGEPPPLHPNCQCTLNPA